jgi:hypothetical protein
MPITAWIDPVTPTTTNPAQMPSSSARPAVGITVTVGVPPWPQSSRWVPPTNGQLWPRIRQG